MEAHLSPNAETFLAHVVAAGAYRDIDEALEAGVNLLRARTELQQRLKNSRAQLDRGEGLDLDDEGLSQLFHALRTNQVSQTQN